MAPSSPAAATASSEAMAVRPFRDEDLPQVLQLFRAGMLAYPEVQVHSEFLEQYLAESLSTDLSNIQGTYMTPGGNFWVATPKAEPSLVVGMVGLEAKPGQEGELRRMSVKESHRRYGIGRLLIATLEHWALEHNYKTIWLTTGGVMDKACAFYKSVGYTHTDTIVMDEEPHFVGLKFEKHLGNDGADVRTPSPKSAVLPSPTKEASSECEVAIRQYRPEDWPQMAELFREGILHYADNQNNPLADEFIDTALKTGDLKDVHATYMAPGGNFWVATPREDLSLVVGIVGLEVKPNGEGSLRHMSVRDGYRRLGIGRKLVAEMEQWAEKQRYRKVSLTTRAVMDKARAFYQSAGYAHTDTFVVNEDPFIEIVKFEKPLGESSSTPAAAEAAV